MSEEDIAQLPSTTIITTNIVTRDGEEERTAEKTLYERLGGMFAIAAVVDRFSDQLLNNPKFGNQSKNPALKEWHTKKYVERLPGLKFGRTLWVCAIAGGPFQYTGKTLRDAHFDLHIKPEEFDEVSAELARALDYFKVPRQEKQETLAAFNAQKPDVTAGSRSTTKK